MFTFTKSRDRVRLSEILHIGWCTLFAIAVMILARVSEGRVPASPSRFRRIKAPITARSTHESGRDLDYCIFGHWSIRLHLDLGNSDSFQATQGQSAKQGSRSFGGQSASRAWYESQSIPLLADRAFESFPRRPGSPLHSPSYFLPRTATELKTGAGYPGSSFFSLSILIDDLLR